MATTRSEIETGRLRGRWFGLAALTASGLVLGLDITILITALPTLSAKLSATTDQLQWMSAAYTLSLAGFMLPAGVLGDRFGRKRVLPAGETGAGSALTRATVSSEDFRPPRVPRPRPASPSPRLSHATSRGPWAIVFCAWPRPLTLRA